jgi:hypothetical protein|tara:strand:- start:1266 stop:1460 length:195 start_codon:yes stop_codon:yes gene_type:complete
MLNIAATYVGEVGGKGVEMIGMNRIPYCLGTETFHVNHKHLIYLSKISTYLFEGGLLAHHRACL